MRYFLDTEFNGFGGDLISLALVREDGGSIYLVRTDADMAAINVEPWVAENVVPILLDCPAYPGNTYHCPLHEWGRVIAILMHGDPAPVIVTDWPDDIRYFCERLIVGPGQMVNVPSLRFEMQRVDAYPTELEGAVQHNAWWDAMALRALFIPTRKAA